MTIKDVHRNKLHMELIDAGIDVTYVFAIDDTEFGARLILGDDVDMDIVQDIVDRHIAEPPAPEMTENEMLMLAVAELDAQREQDKIETQLAIAELAETLLGGGE